MIGPPFKWPGSKARMARRINELLPLTPTYLEPFAGSCCVFLARERSRLDVVNDQDQEIVNALRVTRNHPVELARRIALTPWSRAEYRLALEPTEDPIERARRWYVRCWQGYGARHLATPSWRRRVSARSATGPGTWAGLPNRVIAVAERFLPLPQWMVEIEETDALQLLRDFRNSDTAVYADPPYHPKTIGDDRLYRHQLSQEQHEELLNILIHHPGPVALSGYACEEYDQALRHWTRLEFAARAESGGHRTEVLWLNPAAAAALRLNRHSFGVSQPADRQLEDGRHGQPEFGPERGDQLYGLGCGADNDLLSL